MKQSKTKTGSGGNESQSSSWPFFNQLSFLSDTIKPRSMQSSVPPVESDNMSITTDEGEEIYDSEELADVGHTDLPSTPGSHWGSVDIQQQASTTSSAKKQFKSPFKKKINSKKELSKFDEKILEIENKKAKYLEEKTTRTQDGDYQFLMSLLPFLHDIPKERKLFVRKKMMDVVMNEFEKQTPNTPSHSTPNHSSDDSSGVHYNTSSFFQNFDPTGNYLQSS